MIIEVNLFIWVQRYVTQVTQQPLTMARWHATHAQHSWSTYLRYSPQSTACNLTWVHNVLICFAFGCSDGYGMTRDQSFSVESSNLITGNRDRQAPAVTDSPLRTIRVIVPQDQNDTSTHQNFFRNKAVSDSISSTSSTRVSKFTYGSILHTTQVHVTQTTNISLKTLSPLLLGLFYPKWVICSLSSKSWACYL